MLHRDNEAPLIFKPAPKIEANTSQVINSNRKNPKNTMNLSYTHSDEEKADFKWLEKSSERK